MREDVRLPYRAPRSNSFAERWVGTVRREILDHVLIFGHRHLEAVLSAFVEHYHEARPHQGLAQRCPGRKSVTVDVDRNAPVVRRDLVGGILHEYARAA